MIRSAHIRSLLALAISIAGCATIAPAAAFSETQWRCEAGPDGAWQCGEVAVDTGPFEPVATAPVYDQSAARSQAGNQRPYGQTEEMARLTWVPRQALPPTAAAQVPAWCSGAYQPLEFTSEELAADPRTALIALSAESGEYVVDASATLTGGVRIDQGARRIEAELASYDALEQALALEGEVLVQEPGILLRGDSARVELVDGNAEFQGAEFVLYEGSYRGRAETVRRADGTLQIDEGVFTRCEPGNEGWKVAAGRIEIPEGEAYAVATDARLEIFDVPVFWAPKLTVPINDERKTGLLFPSVGFSDQNGADLSAPMYLNLAPNYDATFTPRLMSERGVLLEGEFRHMTASMENLVGGAVLPKDDNYDGDYSFDEFRELVSGGRLPPGRFEAEQRWIARIDHRGTWVPGLTSRVDFTAVSDDDYLRDLGTDLASNGQPELDRSASVRLRRGGLEATLWAQDVRILEENRLDPYERLPQFDLSWHERFGDVPMVFGVDAQYAEFDRGDALATGREQITGSRLHMVPRFTMPVEWSWGHVEADVAWQYTRYNLRLPAALQENPADQPRNPNAIEDNPTRILPTASFDMGLRFERDVSIAGTPLLQTLEPRLYYLYIEDEDQSDLPLFDTADLTFGTEQLFRDNRFSGIDRIGDANQVTLALTSRAITRSDGTELLRGTAGRIIYRDDQIVTLNGVVGPQQRSDQSGWVTDLVLRLGGGYDAKALWVWNSEDSSLDQGLVRFRYRGGPRSIFNVGYRSRGQGIEQVDMNFSWPFSPTMALIGRYFYDLEQEEALEAFGGVQYDDCCWRLRLVGRQYLRPTQGLDLADSETGVFVEVVMKGLAGFDSGLGSALDQGIYGFGPQDENAFRL